MAALVLAPPSMPALAALEGLPAPMTEQALCSGGDGRIRLRADGRNAYGCPPRPEPGLIALGSSTASVVSSKAFAAAQALHRQMLATPAAAVRAAQGIRHEIALLSGATRIAGSEVVLAASGTDVHLLATRLLPSEGDGLQVLMAEGDETGRGVASALAGCHFDASTCQGRTVRPLEALEGGASGRRPVVVGLRRPDGSLRPCTEVEAEFEGLAEEALRAGRQVLLVLTDLSKTGLMAPSPASVSRLQARWPQRLQVLVDACQFRLAEATVADYLGRGWMVALTGSKFVGGPAFCGALLLPEGLARDARRRSLQGLAAYSCRPDWPLDWAAAEVLDAQPNIGLLLRWEAALSELRAFRRLPPDFIVRALQFWGEAVSQRLQRSPLLQALPTAPLRRAHMAWDSWPTIFPFTVSRPAAEGCFKPLSREETAALHRLLRDGLGPGRRTVQLGQPVACGAVQGVQRSALRVCIGLRMLCDAAGHAQGAAEGLAQTRREIDLALDELEALVLRPGA